MQQQQRQQQQNGQRFWAVSQSRMESMERQALFSVILFTACALGVLGPFWGNIYSCWKPPTLPAAAASPAGVNQTFPITNATSERQGVGRAGNDDGEGGGGDDDVRCYSRQVGLWLVWKKNGECCQFLEQIAPRKLMEILKLAHYALMVSFMLMFTGCMGMVLRVTAMRSLYGLDISWMVTLFQVAIDLAGLTTLFAVVQFFTLELPFSAGGGIVFSFIFAVGTFGQFLCRHWHRCSRHTSPPSQYEPI